MNMAELQQEVFEFAERTFGPGREDAAWKKLFEELGEVLKAPRSPGEWGDVFILLFDLATIYGVQVDEATRSKLAVIADRVWSRTETGTFQHVPGAEKQAPAPSRTCVFQQGPLASAVPREMPGWHTFYDSYAPEDHDGPGEYYLDRVDRAMGGSDIGYYTWVPF